MTLAISRREDPNYAAAQSGLQTLCSTLIGVTATLLGILAAAVGGYLAFLEDRASQYDDRVEAIPFNVQAVALQLQRGGMISSFLPPNFDEVYADAYPDLSNVELPANALRGLLSHDKKLSDAMEQALKKSSKFYQGEWQGRLVLWALGKSVNILAPFSSGSPQSGTEAFPNSVTGPGFEEWRRSFEKVQNVAFVSRMLWGSALSVDLQNYAARLEVDWQRKVLLDEPAVQIPQFFSAIESINASLKEIDTQKALRKKYSFVGRVHTAALAALSALSILFGIIVPLLLLGSGRPLRKTSMIAISLASLALTLAASLLFAIDLATPPTLSRSEYMKTRWYQPLLAELSKKRSALEETNMLNSDMYTDALGAIRDGTLDVKIDHELKAYGTRPTSRVSARAENPIQRSA